MKTFPVLRIFLFLEFSDALTDAAVIVHEPFNYSAGLLTNQNGGVGWAGGWTNVTSSTNLVVSPGAQYDDGLYHLTATGNAWQARGLGAGSVRYLPSTLGQTGEVFYLSFVGKLNNLFGYAGVFLDENTTANFTVGYLLFGSPTWACARIGAAGVSSSVSITNQSFIVVRLDYTNNNVIVRFYVNPPLDAEPASPAGPPLTTTAFKFNRVRLQAGDGLRTDMLDELRIGSTWADVTPHSFAPHLITVSNASVVEGNSGTTNLAFTVRMSRTNDLPVTVNFFTTNGTAIAGTDYTATNGVLTFNPGETNQVVQVAVTGETSVEFDETFSVVLSNAVNAQIRAGQGVATGTILDDDYVPPPLFAYEPFAYAGGQSLAGLNGGTGWSNAWTGNGAVTIVSPGLTHLAGSSFLAVSGNACRGTDPSFFFYSRDVQDLARIKSGSLYLSFLGQVSAGTPNISLYEGGSQRLIIGTPGGGISTWSAVVLGATLRVLTSSVPVSTKSLLVLRFDLAGTNTTLRFYVNPPLDAEPAIPTGTTNIAGLRFDRIGVNSGGPAGTASFDEIRVASTWAAAAPVGPPPPPGIAVSDGAVYESNLGMNLVFNVSLAYATVTNVTVNFATTNGSALAGSDYAATNGILTFAPGETNMTVVVPVIGDAIAETNETFSLLLSDPVNGTIADDLGVGFILDEDTIPRLAIGPGRVFEGNIGTNHAVFRVRLSQIFSGTVSIDYTTTNGNATAGVDYAATNGTVTFAPGEIRKFISVPVFGDMAPELNETFTVRLSNPVNCTPVNTNGPGLIGDDDIIMSTFTNRARLEDGDPVPVEPGRVFKQFIGGPVVNVFGEVAFVASTMLLNGSAVETNLWLWLGPTNELRKVAGPTMQPPDSPPGSTYNGEFAVPNLDDEGNLTFFAGVNLAASARNRAAAADEEDSESGLFVAQAGGDPNALSGLGLYDDEQIEYYKTFDTASFSLFAKAFGAIFDFAGAYGIRRQQPLHVNEHVFFECNLDDPDTRTLFRWDVAFDEFYKVVAVGDEDPCDGDGVIEKWQQHAVDEESRLCVSYTTDDEATTLAIVEPSGECHALATTGEELFPPGEAFAMPEPQFSFDGSGGVVGAAFTFFRPPDIGPLSVVQFKNDGTKVRLHTTPAVPPTTLELLANADRGGRQYALVAETIGTTTIIKEVTKEAEATTTEVIVLTGQTFYDTITGTNVQIAAIDTEHVRYASEREVLSGGSYDNNIPYVPVVLQDGRQAIAYFYSSVTGPAYPRTSSLIILEPGGIGTYAFGWHSGSGNGSAGRPTGFLVGYTANSSSGSRLVIDQPGTLGVKLFSPRISGGNFSFELRGRPEQTYRIESSPDGQTWAYVTDVTTDTSGRVTFSTPISQSGGQLFRAAR